MPDVTIGFAPRDRFCKAAESLERIFENTADPFNLIVVDCAIPAVFRKQMEEVLRGRPNVRTIREDRYLLTNQMHNIIIGKTETEFLLLMENDILPERGWLSDLVAACEGHPADVAVPLLVERHGSFEKVHFDDRLGRVEPVLSDDGPKYRIVPRGADKGEVAGNGPETVELIEVHCVLYRRKVFDLIGPFDETLSARAEVDLSLALYKAKVPVVFEPKARVIYSPPPPIYPEERDYYLFKWNVERAERNHDTLKERWGLLELPSSRDFVKMRRQLASDLDPDAQMRRETDYRTAVEATASDIEAVVPAGDCLILVDGQELNAGEVAHGRRVIPFLERGGVYWGAPADDATGIAELERLCEQAKPGFIFFAWPALWWLDHYRGLHDHLFTHFPCILQNDRLVAFDLRSPRSAEA